MCEADITLEKYAVEVHHVSMKFNLMEEKVDSLKEYVMRLVKGKLLYNEFVALSDISLCIERGDVFGFLGTNGAGKSTLLKLIAGILIPTKGKVLVRGSIAPLIEVGAGFDPDLTARENIYLNGAILGYNKKFLDDHFDKILDFAELESFVDVPVKNFSSGMYARLGFSIATEVKPDILIVDEVLSVGDFRFQKKCKRRIQEMIEMGTTVVMVSHDISTIGNFCQHALWLEHGMIKLIGRAQDVCNAYERAQ